MAKEKLTLQDLQIQSIVTSLEAGEMQQVKGGYTVVRGRNRPNRVRWTSVDTRADISDRPQNLGWNNQ